MKVLVTVGSKHGASEEIGEAIRSTLQEQGIEAVAIAPGQVSSLSGFDAVVVGSGIYAGRWVDSAKQFVDANLDALRALPVWVFSSGPIGSPPKPEEDPPDGVAVAERVQAREHRVLAGKLDRDGLGFGERAIVGMLRAPSGDFRDWSTIRDWSTSIANSLSS